MYSKDVLVAKFELILEHIDQVNVNTTRIKKPEDYVNTTDGVVLFDASLMRLQTIGENLKKIQQVAPEILQRKQGIDWDSIIRLRDIISHHYEKLQEEVVFDICTVFIPELEKTIRNIIKELTG